VADDNLCDRQHLLLVDPALGVHPARERVEHRRVEPATDRQQHTKPQSLDRPQRRTVDASGDGHVSHDGPERDIDERGLVPGSPVRQRLWDCLVVTEPDGALEC
jgi:hypothetical protein